LIKFDIKKLSIRHLIYALLFTLTKQRAVFAS
jgi:hypothetical protein